MLKQFQEKRRSLAQAYQNITPAEKISFCAVVLFALASLCYCTVRGDITNVLICLVVIVMAFAPRFLEWLFGLRFSTFFKVFVVCYIAAGSILGSVFDFYYRFANWDTLLHLICGFLMGMIGYMLLDILNRGESAHISMASRILSALTFALAAAVVWEFYEYAMDTFLNFDMQCDTVVHQIKSYLVGASPVVVDTIDNITSVTVNGVDLGVGGYLDLGHIDTMNDMLCNTAGGVLFCVLAILSARRPDNLFARVFIPKLTSCENGDTQEP